MDIRIARHADTLASDWATVLAASKNGVFLFDRQYLDYHGDRFVDMSSIAYVDGKPVALMAAAFDTDTGTVTSHPGLTFGGVVLRRELRGDVAMSVIDATLDAMRDWGARDCTVKLLPGVFAAYPSGELDYMLWRRGFALVRRDVFSILPLRAALPFNTSKRQAVKRARGAGVQVATVASDAFHALLVEVLAVQHGVAPVHSAAELSLLAARFPANIHIRGAHHEGLLVAGAVFFDYGHVWHAQYLAASATGRELGALDLVIAAVRDEALAAGATYLSLGKSTDDAGRTVNAGLLWQKESYGARSVVHDFMHGAL